MNEEIIDKVHQPEKNNPMKTVSEDLSSPQDKARTQTIENAPAPGEECAP